MNGCSLKPLHFGRCLLCSHSSLVRPRIAQWWASKQRVVRLEGDLEHLVQEAPTGQPPTRRAGVLQGAWGHSATMREASLRTELTVQGGRTRGWGGPHLPTCPSFCPCTRQRCSELGQPSHRNEERRISKREASSVQLTNQYWKLLLRDKNKPFLSQTQQPVFMLLAARSLLPHARQLLGPRASLTPARPDPTP